MFSDGSCCAAANFPLGQFNRRAQVDLSQDGGQVFILDLGRRFVGEEVAEGHVELGVQQLSELRLETDITVVGALPEELQKLSVVSAAVSSKARAPAAGLQFLEFLATPYARQAMRDSGLDLPLEP